MNTSANILSRFSKYLLPLLTIFLVLFLPSLYLGGVTWDEIFDFEGVNGSFWHGINVLKGVNPDLSTITFDLEYFGNATRWPTYLFWRLTNVMPWESFQATTRDAFILASNYVGLNHLNAAFFGFAGIALTGFLGLLLAGKRLMAWSATLLLLLPTWIGHSWMNSKDIPFATSYLLYTLGSTYLFLAPGKKLSGGSPYYLSQITRALGVCLLLGSRIGSASFIATTELIYILLLRDKFLRVRLLSLAAGILGAFLITPQGWGDPFGYPLEAAKFISTRQRADSPWDTFTYISWHLFDSIPFFILLGFLLCLVSLVARKKNKYAVMPWVPIFLQLTVAPVLLIAGSKSLYNELRHIEFIYPALCIFSGLGYVRLFSSLKHNGRVRKIVLLPLAFFLSVLALEVLLLSPYQYVYRSDLSRVLFAGIPIHRDYWGFSVRETFDRAIKSPVINSIDLSTSVLRNGDWNQALFDGYIQLLSSPKRSFTESSNSTLEFQISPETDQCSSIVETRRLVLLPKPSLQLLSRYADCQDQHDVKY